MSMALLRPPPYNSHISRVLIEGVRDCYRRGSRQSMCTIFPCSYAFKKFWVAVKELDFSYRYHKKDLYEIRGVLNYADLL